MSCSSLITFVRMLVLAIGLFTFFWITDAKTDDVYNFYFQKGNAPNSVVQGGGGQTAVPKQVPNAEIEEAVEKPKNGEGSNGDQNEELRVSSTGSAKSASLTEAETKRTRKRFAATLGYSGLKDPVGVGQAFTGGLQYNFNPYIGTRLQGRWRNLRDGEVKALSNRLGGMMAFVLTPLRLDLFGHRFLEISANVGAETFRSLASVSSSKVSVAPLVGASALLSLNETVGIELQASKSTKASFIAANLALLF